MTRDHPLLFGYLTTLFRDRPTGAERIDIVIDRRHGEAPKAPEIDRRRAPSAVDDELRRRGFAFVTQPGEAFSPRDAARIERTVELLAGMEDRSWPFRRRRRPLWRRWQRLWTQRPWKPLAALGVVALVSTLFATEFRISDYREPDRPKPSRPVAARPPAPAPQPAATPVQTAAPPQPAATPPKPVQTAAPTTAKAPTAPVAPAPASTPAPAPAPPASVKPAEPPPVASTALFAPLSPPASPQAAATSQANTAPRAMTERDATIKPVARPAARPESPTRPENGARPVMASARAVTTGATVTETPAATAPSSPDLRLELSRRPTSATGGGFVYTARVTDLNGQPRSDARVWLAAGRGASGAQFETRMYPADAAGTYRSGVVHPSTLPPDIMVKAQVGDRHVEAPVER